MDGGRPFRMSSQGSSSPARRTQSQQSQAQPSVPSRSHQQPAYSTPEPTREAAKDENVPETQAPVAQPASSHSSPSSTTPSKKKTPLKKRAKLLLGIGGAVLVVALLWWAIGTTIQNSKTAIDPSKYQAVFFTNGQVYFGKLSPYNDSYMLLNEVYYLQTNDSEGDNPQETSTSDANVQLIKLGEEIHGPLDEMIVSRDQVLFYENLSPEGKVVQSIEQYKRSNT